MGQTETAKKFNIILIRQDFGLDNKIIVKKDDNNFIVIFFD
jgi:hypothetical protein